MAVRQLAAHSGPTCGATPRTVNDEALRLIYSFTEKLPIAPPTDEARAEAEEAVGRLVAITRAEQESRRDALDWLRVEYGVEKPGQKLQDFAALTGDEFVEEVRKRRPKGAGRFSPAGSQSSCEPATKTSQHPCAKPAPKPPN